MLDLLPGMPSTLHSGYWHPIFPKVSSDTNFPYPRFSWLIQLAQLHSLISCRNLRHMSLIMSWDFDNVKRVSEHLLVPMYWPSYSQSKRPDFSVRLGTPQTGPDCCFLAPENGQGHSWAQTEVQVEEQELRKGKDNLTASLLPIFPHDVGHGDCGGQVIGVGRGSSQRHARLSCPWDWQTSFPPQHNKGHDPEWLLYPQEMLCLHKPVAGQPWPVSIYPLLKNV